MFSRLLKRRVATKAPAAPVAPAVPDGMVVWAVGDIHGRLDLLQPLIDAILADATARDPTQRTCAIFLGDYIDRGPASRGVLQLLAGLPKDGPVEWRFLKGNHEQAMLDFLAEPARGAQWCEYGGDATLASFGLSLPPMRHKLGSWATLSADLNHKLTAVESQFLESLELGIDVGDYFFAHAGARPGVSLATQSVEDLMWIRRSFLDSDYEFEKVVVHGHTPTEAVHADRRRIGVDTKAYESGILTALRLEGRTRQLLQTDKSGEVRWLALS